MAAVIQDSSRILGRIPHTVIYLNRHLDASTTYLLLDALPWLPSTKQKHLTGFFLLYSATSLPGATPQHPITLFFLKKNAP
ncbi:hypothetical protein [Methylicorpusculum sp.]|jgi:hypothetical protein|uniref:hypothetical protein n=1 Tax=Methylicorpusculum sp. TaxID=2713644 RepID=UPI002ABC6BAA|nr:hypothetical protein [Methylicorpusculum sp.]MDZ4154399.1 hypothetical protein [Methylicorpusculum sp.]